MARPAARLKIARFPVRKRKPLLSDERMAEVWDIRSLEHAEGELRDFDKLVSSAVSRCLAEDKGNRVEIANRLSVILGERITVMMLDSYSSEARREHHISASRFLALLAVTRRFDILDAVLREVGGKALDRADARIFKLGQRYIASINAERDLRDTVDGILQEPT
ncbi:hypothetical protein [Sphingomonas caeni]|uniref:hypothetical protein n=1 Tax=Sphingomonas caeni TaxID=2984949 RepID=UPI0022302036|nr:hypothetical protein [Sphingomonas caeni]